MDTGSSSPRSQQAATSSLYGMSSIQPTISHHKRELWGAKGGGANAPPIFFSLRIFFLSSGLRGANKKYKYSRSYCLGGVKTKNEKPLFYRTHSGSILTPIVDFAAPPPSVLLAKLRLCLPPSLFKTHFNIILPSTHIDFSQWNVKFMTKFLLKEGSVAITFKLCAVPAAQGGIRILG
jgi:hypothetical protein